MNRFLSVLFAFAVFGVFADGNLDKPKWHAEIIVPGVTVYHADIDDPKTLYTKGKYVGKIVYKYPSEEKK